MTEGKFTHILNMNNLQNQDLFKNIATFCFTDHYCNKLYYRTISNDKSNVLCRKSSTSFDMIKVLLGTASSYEIDYLTLADIIRPHAWKILTKIKLNFLKHSKDDFKKFFLNVKPSNCSYAELSKVIDCVIRILESIVPSEVYGCRKNQKVFYNTVRFILNGMSGQHITVEQILNKWNIDTVLWLNSVPNLSIGYKILILLKFVVFLIRNIVCSVIAVTFYVTTSQLSHETRKLYYYYRSDWQKLSDTFLLQLSARGDLVKSDIFSIGSRSKRRIPLSERTKIKSTMKSLPVMRLMLKSNSTVRVIIRYKKKTQLEKSNEKIRRYLFQTINPRNPLNMIDKYTSFFTKWAMLGKPKLYFVKADILDAFGSVDIDVLQTILSKLHTNFQSIEKNPTRKKTIAKEYQRLLDELNRPVLVRRGSCVYEWKRGLVQGMKYSPILCEIFYKEMDQRHLSKFFSESDDEIKLLVRLVDDYLFVTDSVDKARDFIKHMSERVKINPSKTKINFEHDLGVCVDRITFFGYVINTCNLEVSRDETVYSGQLKYRIAFNQAISQPLSFLEKRITQTTVPLSPLLLSLRINSIENVLKNVFISLCISANKFCTIIPMICCDNDNLDAETLFKVYKRKVAVRMCDFIVKIVIESVPHGEFPYCINHFRYVAYKALSLFASKSNVCMKLMPFVRSALKKCNCMEGTWKPHYGSVDRHGVPNRMAVREICRKYDIKKNVLLHTSTPDEFEPYIR
ncbi:telomerase reverse transcriptase-like [Arctopsyche grandis]|uniref:telomerase reverse transcriptase-like n=1 Tax=Arctopsyche grandis TaxID=121162 RepID=UPI00406D7D4D